jgi:hypothetical protein
VIYKFEKNIEESMQIVNVVIAEKCIADGW